MFYEKGGQVLQKSMYGSPTYNATLISTWANINEADAESNSNEWV